MLVICLPGAWIVLNSLRPTVEIMAKPPVWIPQKLSLDAYTSMFGGLGQGGVPVLEYFRNSLIISITSTVIAVAIGMAGGYAFARYRFKGKSALFLGLMLTRTVPGIALSLPLFIIFARIGLIDTHFGLILVYVALNVPFTIWLIDGFFRQVPRDLAEAAQIDGCTPLAGVLAGRVSARRPRHRLGRDLRLPDVLERVRARFAAHPLGERQDAAGRTARLHLGVHHRLARHVRSCGGDDRARPGADLHHPEAARLRADLRRGERLIPWRQ